MRVSRSDERLLPGPTIRGGTRTRRTVMKRITIVAGMLLLSIVPRIHAQDQVHEKDRCSNADLRGIYSFVASGTMSGVGAFATAGQTTYEGNGNVSGLIQISLNGTVTPVLP